MFSEDIVAIKQPLQNNLDIKDSADDGKRHDCTNKIEPTELQDSSYKGILSNAETPTENELVENSNHQKQKGSSVVQV